MSVLQKIGDRSAELARERERLLPREELARLAEAAPWPRPFDSGLIAEIKFASPSEGEIRPGSAEAAVDVASRYLSNGATALSILTEPEFFRGSYDYLSAVRRAHPRAPILMKDFVVGEYQLFEARRIGADAALLIVALLGEERCRALKERALGLGLSVLVEVHDEEELAIAARIGSDLIGVNNRDLKTLRVSLDTSYRLSTIAPRGARLVSESGISDSSQIRDLRQAGYSGFLVGTSLMRQPDPGQALKQLLTEDGGARDGGA